MKVKDVCGVCHSGLRGFFSLLFLNSNESDADNERRGDVFGSVDFGVN